MTRGVKSGVRRGHYRRFNKNRLRKLARDILNGNIDHEAVAQAFESGGGAPDLLIAWKIRAGAQYEPVRLASAVEGLGNRTKMLKTKKPLPLWMVKAALKHQRGMTLHKALGDINDYTEDPHWRAYHRRMNADYGKRSKKEIELKLHNLWPKRIPGQFPEIEKAIREALSGRGVPLAVYRAQARRVLSN
jgi:hypothetical protein